MLAIFKHVHAFTTTENVLQELSAQFPVDKILDLWFHGVVTDQEIIKLLRGKALEIMREKVDPDNPSERADRLFLSMRYLACCSILNNEVPEEALGDFIEKEFGKQCSGN